MQPSNDERTLAALAHASIVTNGLSLIGLIAAATIWATQRERSRYVSGHAIQALAFQGLTLVVALILGLSWGMCLVLSLLPLALRPELYPNGQIPGPFWLALSGMVIPALFGLLATIYGLFGAVQAYRGRPFFYPLVGRMALPDLAPTPTPTLGTPAPASVPAQPEPLPAVPVPAVPDPAPDPVADSEQRP
jgi:uncharacterized Tic20 family protein